MFKGRLKWEEIQNLSTFLEIKDGDLVVNAQEILTIKSILNYVNLQIDVTII